MTHGNRKWLIVMVVAVWVGLWNVSAVVAQAAPVAKGVHDIGVTQQLSLQELLDRGGTLTYLLCLMSVGGVALVIYFLVILRRQQIVPDMLRDDVLDKIETGQLDDARTACGYKPCAFSEVAVAALDYVNSVDKPDPVMLKEVIEGEGSRQATAMQSQIQYLLDIGVIAPMVGLLGTVFGMVHAFSVVALDLAKAKPMILAAGVTEALVNTAGGLIVGIPAMMFYAFFRGRTSKLVSDLEVASMNVFAALVQRKPGK
ncbi:MAG: MotA/TolQ/ExbB proton channel family protein [bacterium]